MAVKNATILAKMYLEGTNDYQQRVPNPSQATISQTRDAIFSPMNNMIYNQFIDTLVNRIGFTFVHQNAWKNPLAVFKSGKYNYGSTIQEIGVNWIKAHTYEDDLETLLKMHRPEVQQAFHTLNRQDQYPISITRPELQQAFTTEYGLNDLVAAVMQAPINSDNYDEYCIMKQLIGGYEDKFGFFKVHVEEPDDEATAKAVLRLLRTYKDKLQFPSTLYNAAPITVPTFAKPEELVLFVTPEVSAAIDVEALAQLFNLEKAEARIRKIVIDEFPIAGAQALLTTDGFYVCQDNLYENTSFYNPQTLTTNYFLTHWSTLSVSPFVPAILFTTGEGSVVNSIKLTPTSLEIASAADTIAPGGKVQLTTTLNGTLEPEEDGIEIAPDAALYQVSATRTSGEATESVALNNRTYVDRLGVLHLQKSGVQAGDKVKVVATSTYTNPSGVTTPMSATVELTVA